MDKKELIINGLRYIDFFDIHPEPKEININLLIEIRMYLLTKSSEWYKEKFPFAYSYDIGETRHPENYYYSDDGIKYIFDDEMYLKECILYHKESQKTVMLSPPVRFSFHIKRGTYRYINEIDHFFTYCINNYLLDKEFSASSNEKGITSVKNTIEEFYSPNNAETSSNM